jgi:hypothetical protein
LATPQQTLDFFTRANTLMNSIMLSNRTIGLVAIKSRRKNMVLTSDFLSRRGMRHYAKKVNQEYFTG